MSSSSRKVWVDPEGLPDVGDVSQTKGNVPRRIKQLCMNTVMAYGVGNDEACFGYLAGKKVHFTYINVEPMNAKDSQKGDEGGVEVKTVAEVTVDKSMVNGNDMLHGGCIAYFIDNCGSTPLVVLGLLTKKNGVGVTQALNVLYQSPAPLGTVLEIVSTSLALGGRSMTARCEIYNKENGRLVASAFITKMQPSKL